MDARTIHPRARAYLRASTDSRCRRTPLARSRRQIMKALEAEFVAIAPHEQSTDLRAGGGWRLALAFALNVGFLWLVVKVMWGIAG